MSLINDALRKARQAAAEHDEQQAPQRAPRAYPSRARGSRSSTWLLALVAVVAAAAGGAGVWWLMGPARTPVQAEDAEPADGTTLAARRNVGGPAAARADTDQAEDRVGGQDQADPPDLDDGPRYALESEVAAGTGDPEPAPDGEAGTAGARSGPSLSAAESRADQKPDAELAAKTADLPSPSSNPAMAVEPLAAPGRIFVLDAEVGGRPLSLGYIVFRPVRPFAEINGVEVYEGSEVDGFTVERIEADRVILRDADGPLELRTK